MIKEGEKNGDPSKESVTSPLGKPNIHIVPEPGWGRESLWRWRLIRVQRHCTYPSIGAVTALYRLAE